MQIVVVLDRSGSMMDVKPATISAFNEFLKSTQNDSPDVGLTLVQFNTTIETLFGGLPAKDCLPLTNDSYRPDGMTALHDAVFKTIRATEARVQPDEKILFCVLTDGQENSSREHDLDSLKALIAEKEATKNWTFTYLGANQDAWAVGAAMGIPVGNVANYKGTATGTMAAIGAMSAGRASWTRNAGGQTASFYGRKDIPEDETPEPTMTTTTPASSPTWPGKK